MWLVMKDIDIIEPALMSCCDLLALRLARSIHFGIKSFFAVDSAVSPRVGRPQNDGFTSVYPQVASLKHCGANGE